MTLEACAQFCSSGTYNGGAFNYFGTEYGREVSEHLHAAVI